MDIEIVGILREDGLYGFFERLSGVELMIELDLFIIFENSMVVEDVEFFFEILGMSL